MKNKYLKRTLKVLGLIGAAIIDAIFFKVIVEQKGFLSMGASGVAVIISRVLGNILDAESLVSIMYMLLYFIINIPLFIIGYKKISKKFILYTSIYVVTYSLAVGFIPSSLSATIGFNELDMLTSAVVGGLAIGFASTGALLFGGCTGGISIISTYLNVKKGKGIGMYQFIINTCILLVGLLIFRDLPSIIYTLVYAFFSSLVLDRYYNRNKKILLEIVTSKKEEICKYLLENSHHGCTIMEARGAYTNEEKYVIHTAISWFQLKSITRGIKKIDSESFVINTSVYSVNGHFYMPPIK